MTFLSVKLIQKLTVYLVSLSFVGRDHVRKYISAYYIKSDYWLPIIRLNPYPVYKSVVNVIESKRHFINDAATLNHS